MKLLRKTLFILVILSSYNLTAQETEDLSSRFSIATFYNFSSYKDIELKNHTNNYKLTSGNSSFTFPQELLDSYNDNNDTEHQYNLFGVKLGYNILTELKLNLIIGLTNYKFTTWISDDNSPQTYRSDYPSLNVGTEIFYNYNFSESFAFKLHGGLNYFHSYSHSVENNSGEDVESMDANFLEYEGNLALKYNVSNFTPMIGCGYLNSQINIKHEEKILINETDDKNLYDYVEFDSEYAGSYFYGFIGLEYSLNSNIDFLLKVDYSNLVRAHVSTIIKL